MKKREITKLPWKELLLCMAAILLYMLLQGHGAAAKPLMAAGLVLTALMGVYWRWKKKLNGERILFLILTAGIILRFGYTLYTHAYTRGHDIGEIKADGTGHYGYLYNIINGGLPKTNANQFYHPPLYYIVSALFIKPVMLIKQGTELKKFLYMAQLASCISSSTALIYFKRCMDELRLGDRVKAIALALTACYPALIYAAGRMNNDAMAYMFMIMAMYYTIRWYKRGKMSDIVGIALSIGCGMMTKINSAMTAFITGPVMLYVLYKTLKTKDAAKIKTLVIQLAVFAAICVPLGLWYPIRNLIKFGQPLNYVLDLGKNHPIYTGNLPLADRWLKFKIGALATEPYMYMGKDANVLECLIRTGVHGEFKWEELPVWIAAACNYAHLLLMLVVLAGTVSTAFADKELTHAQRYGVLAVWLIVAVSYVSFNLSMPFKCTCDFRYVLLGQSAAAVLTAYWTDFVKRRGFKAVYALSMAAIMMFCALSVIRVCI